MNTDKEIQTRIDKALEFKTEQERVDFYKQIGRDEVIEEIDICIAKAFETANDGADIIRAVNLKLTQLKNNP